MIPIQDVVPTGRVPAATLALVALNILFYAAGSTLTAPPPFAHRAIGPLIITLVFLWLFGDNVEARLGRFAFILLYVSGGLIPGLGAAGAVTAVMGSYFVLLPQSRVLMLVPLPPVLVELPALFFLGLWAVLHLLRFVTHPQTIWMFALAFVIGAGVTTAMRPRIRW